MQYGDRMRSRVAVAAVSMMALLAGAVGCTDDGGSDGSSTSTAPLPAVSTTLPAAEQADLDDCDGRVREAAAAMAIHSFPDSPDAQWAVAEVVTEGGLSFVEVVPTPPDGLESSYRLVIECRPGSEPLLFGAYSPGESGWELLFTTDAIGDVELPATVS